MKNNGITEYFENVEITEEYNGYFCSVPDIITIAILGSMCGLKNISQIHQQAANDRISEFSKEKFGINHVPLLLLDIELAENDKDDKYFADQDICFCELGFTLAQQSIDDKSNEISAVQKLLKELNIKETMIVADALNCQKETAKTITKQKADYLLCIKDNHSNELLQQLKNTLLHRQNAGGFHLKYVYRK